VVIYQHFITAGRGGFALSCREYFFFTVSWNVAGVCNVPAASRDPICGGERPKQPSAVNYFELSEPQGVRRVPVFLLHVKEWHATLASLGFLSSPSGCVHG